MSTFGELLNGSVLRKVMPNVGQAYDVATGVGSFVTSGLAAYETIKSEIWNASLFFNRFKNAGKDPQAAFYLVNSLLRQNPILVPPHNGTTNSIKKIINAIKKAPAEHPFTYKGYLKWGEDADISDAEDTLFNILDNSKSNTLWDQNSVLGPKLQGGFAPGLSNFDVKFADTTEYYTELSAPYTQTRSNVKNPLEAIAWATSTLGASIGYKDWQGFSVGTDHIWDMKIKPYIPPSGNTFTPDLPVIDIATWEVNGDDLTLNKTAFDFAEHTPVVTYNLNFGQTRSKDIPLFNESKVTIPLGMSFQNLLSVTLVDDQDRSMFKYMNKYINAVYDPEEYTVAPYDEAAFEIQLIVFKPGYKVNFQFKFICVPVDYSPLLEGSSEVGSGADLKIDFNIIGIKAYSNATGTMESYDNEGSWKDTTWKDVMLVPSRQK